MNKTIDVELKNGKRVNIPNKEVQHLMTSLDLEQDEAIDLWLCDHDYIQDEEEQELTQKAKQNKTTQIYVTDKRKRAKTERKPAENPLKQSIIENFYDFLLINPTITDLKVINKTKIIEFTIENRSFKLDLIEKRQKKAEN